MAIKGRLAKLEARSRAKTNLVEVPKLDFFYGDPTAVEWVPADQLGGCTLADLYATFEEDERKRQEGKK